jgi:hypothetical protein
MTSSIMKFGMPVLIAIMLSVTMQNVVMLNVVAPTNWSRRQKFHPKTSV